MVSPSREGVAVLEDIALSRDRDCTNASAHDYGLCNELHIVIRSTCLDMCRATNMENSHAVDRAVDQDDVRVRVST